MNISLSGLEQIFTHPQYLYLCTKYKMRVIDLNLVSQHMKMHQNIAFAWKTQNFLGTKTLLPTHPPLDAFDISPLPRNEIYV